MKRAHTPQPITRIGQLRLVHQYTQRTPRLTSIASVLGQGVQRGSQPAR